MTVRQLIEKLREFDQDLTVYFEVSDALSIAEVHSVDKSPHASGIDKPGIVLSDEPAGDDD